VLHLHLDEFCPVQHYVEDMELDGALVVVVVVHGHPLLSFSPLLRGFLTRTRLADKYLLERIAIPPLCWMSGLVSAEVVRAGLLFMTKTSCCSVSSFYSCIVLAASL